MKKPNMTDAAKFDHVKTILSTAEKLGAKITNTYDRDPDYEYNGRKRKAFRIRMGRKTGDEIAAAIADELGITTDKLHNWVSDIGVYGDYIMVYDDNDMSASRKFTRDAFHKDDKWEPSDDWHSSDEWSDKGSLNEKSKVTLTMGQLKRLVKEAADLEEKNAIYEIDLERITDGESEDYIDDARYAGVYHNLEDAIEDAKHAVSTYAKLGEKVIATVYEQEEREGGNYDEPFPVWTSKFEDGNPHQAPNNKPLKHGLNENRMNIMKKINENTKVTLTLGQIKRLVKESSGGGKARIERLCAALEKQYDTLTYDEIENKLKSAGFVLDEYGDGQHGPAYATFVHDCGIVVNIEYKFVRARSGKDSWQAGDVTRFDWHDEPDYQRWSTESTKNRVKEDEFTDAEPIDNSAWAVRSIKSVMKKYFEADPFTGKKNSAYDPSFSAEDLIDEIVQILS